MKRQLPALLLLSAILHPSPLVAQRKTQVAGQIEMTGGSSNQAGGAGYNLIRLPSGLSPFYGVTPSLDLKSAGENSQIDLSYSFGLERFQDNSPLTVMSHVASAGFKVNLSKMARLSISDSFTSAPNFSTVNVFRGIEIVPEGFRYVFEPALVQRSGFSNYGRVGLDMDVGPASTLNFGASAGYRRYEDITSFSGGLLNQFRIEGNFGFTRKFSSHHSWRLHYAAVQNRYTNYGNALTHTASLGFNFLLSPSTTLSLDAGPSLVQSARTDKDYLGYYAGISLATSLRDHRFTLGYSHRSGDSTGLGSISDIDSANLALALALGRRTTLQTSLSAYDARGKFDNPFHSRSYYGSAVLAIALARHWSIACGANYRKLVRAVEFDSALQRYYVSLRFSSASALRGGSR